MTRFVRSALFATAGLLVATTSCNDQPTAPKYARAARFNGRESNAIGDLVKYEFTVDASPTSVASGLTASTFARGPGLTAATATGAFNSSGWTASTTSIDPIDYVEFVATPTTGSQFTATELSFAEQRSGTGPPTWLARLMRSDGSFVDLGTGTALNGTLVTHVLPIPSTWQGPYTDALRFRIFAYGATGGTGTFRVDNVVLRGDNGSGGAIPLTATGAANPATVNPGNSTLLTATITSSGPGTTITVVADLTSIGEVNNAPMLDNGTGGDVTAGDKVFSRSATVASGTTLGPKTLPVALSDNEGRTGSTNILLTVTAPPAPPADLVISQVYGGGGNGGSTLTNDFIEIFNRSGVAVNLTGWSVQHTSAAGTTWNVTPLTGSIPAHGYYLVQEAAEGGGTVPLPTPDAAGSIAMGATSGKVILSTQTAALTGACPTATSIIDRVGYGSSTSGNACNTEWGGRTDNLSNTNSAARLMQGCFSTSKGAFDFQVQLASPRNTASAPYTCPAPSAAAIVVNEIMAEPFWAAGGSSWGEWFEVKNIGATPVDLMGWTITTQGQSAHVISSSVVVPPGGIKVLGRGGDPARNGGITLDYNYFTLTPLAIFLDAKDFILLSDASGGFVDLARWTANTVLVLGSTRGLRDASIDNTDVGGANWGYSTTHFGDGDYGTPGAENGILANVPVEIPNKLLFTGRFPDDPALPIGFEDQLFADELIGATGDTVDVSVTWVSLTPTIASIDAFGVIRALSPGTATFQATATDGTVGTLSLPTAIATLGGTAQYGNHAEFGEPADADASDDFIVRNFAFTSSFNKNRNTPNWVSYNIDASHFGPQDRCDCFTHDPALPASFMHINTNDYTGAGTFHGYGIDRGHLARSFDRTTGTLDNAMTYLLSNIIPQAAKLNQQQWGQMEEFLGDKARFQNKEVYVVTGVAGSKGTIKNEGKLTIPKHVWKVAVIMPRDKGLADIHDYRDLEVIAVSIPNDSTSILPWQTNYVVTVDSVEALSGYDLLALLPDNIENAIESNTQPPIAVVNGPWASIEGSSVSMSSAGSIDPNGTIVSYAWNFGDGATGTGASALHTYAQDGNYTVTLTLTDNDGLTDVVTSTATVANVAPTVSAFAGTSLILGEPYSASGTFSDPADAVTATVDYGDGSGVQVLALGAGTYSLSRNYSTTGTFIVTLRISDDDVTTTRTAAVVVLSAAEALQNIAGTIDALVGGGAISAGNANSLTSKIEAAVMQLTKGNVTPAKNQLNALLNEINAFQQSGKLTAPDAASLRAAVMAVLATL